MRWAERCKKALLKEGLWIVWNNSGGMFSDLRKRVLIY